MNIERIKKNVNITSTGCWEWQKSCNSAGYGQLTENKVYWLAHRYSYACLNPELKPTDVVRHSCHNAKCCNPEHLSIGNHKDNWHDSKNRHLSMAFRRRKKWSINGIEYPTIREAVKFTTISFSAILKYTVDGVFDVVAYRLGCKKANTKPKL